MNFFRKTLAGCARLFIFVLWKLGLPGYMYFQLFYLRWLGIRIRGKPKYIAFTSKFDGTDYSIISIGEDTVISGDVEFLTHDYSIMRAAYASGQPPTHVFRVAKPITVGRNCFIGRRGLLLPGTTIGDNVIVGAGSVVSGRIPSDSVVRGNPGRVVRTIQEHYALVMKRDRDHLWIEKPNVPANA